MKRTSIVLLALALAACGKRQPTAAQSAPAGQAALIQRGAPVPAGAAVSVADVLAKPEAFGDKPVVVEGEVRRACSRKGCWMELAPTAKDEGAGMRVTFKDYGFFVPTDSAGAKARVAGAITVAQLDGEEADHLEGEGAHVPRDAQGKPREVHLVATGVELRR